MARRLHMRRRMKKPKTKKSSKQFPKSENPNPVIPPRPSGKPRLPVDDQIDEALFRSIHKTIELDLMVPAIEAEARASLLLLKHRGYAIGDLNEQHEDCVSCLFMELCRAWELNPFPEMKAELVKKTR